jgi:Domain of unknown function (DUF4153)
MTALAMLWPSAVTVAALGTWLLFDASPGVNWPIWTLVASASLALCAGIGERRVPLAILPPLLLGCALAAGAPLTANRAFAALIVSGGLCLLAAAMLLARNPATGWLNLPFVAGLPVIAPLFALIEAARRNLELMGALASARWRAAVRGGAMAVPVVTALALLLAGADPILAAARDTVVEFIERIDFIPRLAFFLTLLTGAVGAGGISLRAGAVPDTARSAPPPTLGVDAQERLIVLGSVAALFGLFLGLQAAYLFGDPAGVVGSGVTYAEYARRGFAELSTAATLCALLILALSRCGAPGHLDSAARAVSLLLVAETGLLLVSAFRRVWLYEGAYGFTTARLYAQTYMIVLGAVLALLAFELRERPVVQRVLRRAMGLGLAAVAALGCWNHEGWIAWQNIARAVETGRLDAGYLVWGLSPNAVPALVEGAGRLPTPLAAEISARLRDRYGANTRLRICSWYEWNLGHLEAARALYLADVPVGGVPAIDPPGGCVRLDPRAGSH